MKPEKIREEYILCAAVWYKDGIVYKEQPRNVSTGIVVSGRRHNNCLMILQQLKSDFDPNLIERKDFGFLTSFDRYVDREEGFIIAHKQKQIWHDLIQHEININFGDDDNIIYDKNILTSEDLYYDITDYEK
jgi:hypothetical protein